LFFAFICNTLGIPIAAGQLYPFFALLLSPLIAVSAMSFSLVAVILNAFRLNLVKMQWVAHLSQNKSAHLGKPNNLVESFANLRKHVEV
jgi:hypothetical protein